MQKRFVKSFVLLPAALVCLHLAAAGLRAQEAYRLVEVKSPRCDLSEVPPIDPPPGGAFATTLNNNPEFRGAVVVYGLEGYARSYAEQIRERMNNFSGVDAARLVTVYGGHEEETRLELWVIPKGAAEPKSNYVEDTQRARLFATYSYWKGDYCGNGRGPALAAFAEALKRRPGWRGHIVVRRHRNTVRPGERDWDPDGNVSLRRALRRAAKDKLSLVKLRVPAAQVKASVGADAGWTHAELWLVPPGAATAARAKQAKVD
jgi:hypothetical protein